MRNPFPLCAVAFALLSAPPVFAKGNPGAPAIDPALDGTKWTAFPYDGKVYFINAAGQDLWDSKNPKRELHTMSNVKGADGKYAFVPSPSGLSAKLEKHTIKLGVGVYDVTATADITDDADAAKPAVTIPKVPLLLDLNKFVSVAMSSKYAPGINGQPRIQQALGDPAVFNAYDEKADEDGRYMVHARLAPAGTPAGTLGAQSAPPAKPEEKPAGPAAKTPPDTHSDAAPDAPVDISSIKTLKDFKNVMERLKGNNNAQRLFCAQFDTAGAGGDGTNCGLDLASADGAIKHDPNGAGGHLAVGTPACDPAKPAASPATHPAPKLSAEDMDQVRQMCAIVKIGRDPLAKPETTEHSSVDAAKDDAKKGDKEPENPDADHKKLYGNLSNAGAAGIAGMVLGSFFGGPAMILGVGIAVGVGAYFLSKSINADKKK